MLGQRGEKGGRDGSRKQLSTESWWEKVSPGFPSLSLIESLAEAFGEDLRNEGAWARNANMGLLLGPQSEVGDNSIN